MHGMFARNTALCINDLIHKAAAALPAAQLLSGRCGKLPSKLGNRIGGHMTSNHSSAYASNIVLDLEFTPAGHAGRAQRLTDEIIEVGAVKVSPEGRVVGEFSQLVKPTLTKGVGGFVHHLTGIGNEDLVQAWPLEEVLPAFAAWVGPGARMVTWSPTDRLQFTHECAAKGLDADALPCRWLDIQRPYPRLIGIRPRTVKLEEAASWCGIPFEASRASRPLRCPDDHRALPHDARRGPRCPTRGHNIPGQEPVRREAPLVLPRWRLRRPGRPSSQPEDTGARLRVGARAFLAGRDGTARL